MLLLIYRSVFFNKIFYSALIILGNVLSKAFACRALASSPEVGNVGFY